MGKGKTRKCRKKFKYSVNRKKLSKRSKRLPGIQNDVMRENWVFGKSIKYNLGKMGLTDDPNAVIKIPNTMELLKKGLATDDDDRVEKKTKNTNDESDVREEDTDAKTTVVEALEEAANRKHMDGFHVSLETSMFAKYMTDKYGKNYKAMTRDPKNYYQWTARQIHKKIKDTERSQMVTATRILQKMLLSESNEESNDISS